MAAPVCGLAFRAAPGRIALVTDAAAAAGMPPGEYLLGGEPITLPAGDGAPPVRADGTLAGSALRMDKAVANAVRCGLALPAAVAAATRIPADLIGRPDLGRLAPGAAADLVWLSPELRTRATWIGGQLVYTDGAAPTVAAVAAPGVTEGKQNAMQDQDPAGRSLMRQEIEQQPEALRATIDALLPRRDEIQALAARTRTVLFIARGTSDNAAVYGSYLIQAHAGRLTSLAAPSIATTYKARIDLSGVLAVALSQSGRTEEIVETLDWARDCGAATMAITNGGRRIAAGAGGRGRLRDRSRGRAGGAGDQDVHHPARGSCGARSRPRRRGWMPDSCGRCRTPSPALLAAPADLEPIVARWPRCRAWWCPAAAWPTPPRWSWRSS